MRSPYLMLAILNAEWLAWLVKTPSKIYLHDQEMVGEGTDGTSIPLNPVKSWIVRGGCKMAIKGRGEQ